MHLAYLPLRQGLRWPRGERRVTPMTSSSTASPSAAACIPTINSSTLPPVASATTSSEPAVGAIGTTIPTAKSARKVVSEAAYGAGPGPEARCTTRSVPPTAVAASFVALRLPSARADAARTPIGHDLATICGMM